MNKAMTVEQYQFFNINKFNIILKTFSVGRLVTYLNKIDSKLKYIIDQQLCLKDKLRPTVTWFQRNQNFFVGIMLSQYYVKQASFPDSRYTVRVMI